MQITNVITVGEIVSSMISLVALVVAAGVAIFQIRLNKRLLFTDQFVQVNVDVFSRQLTSASDEEPIWELQIYNIGKSVVYLTDYLFDGKKNSNINRILPPIYGQAGYYITLPKTEQYMGNDIPQHHIELILSDVEDKKHTCSIFIKYINGMWREEVERCKKCQ